MRRRNNNNDNDNHILTPTERLFYQRLAMEGTQKIIDECWKIINNPNEQEEGYKMSALHIALEGNVQIAEMLKSMKEQYYHSAAAADHDHDHNYDYGPLDKRNFCACMGLRFEC
jgi:hypothetical protein